jgi:hypothetical protein
LCNEQDIKIRSEYEAEKRADEEEEAKGRDWAAATEKKEATITIAQ